MGVPVLAPNSTWFSQGGTTIQRASITEINIVDNYTPTGNETASWDASAALDGSVMVYVTGTVLTIAGNGSGKIMANADSSNLFADTANSDFFSAVSEISGGALVDTSNTTTFFKAFNKCSNLLVSPEIQIRGTDVRALFQLCTSLTTVDASNWDMSQATSFQNLFIHCYNLKTVKGVSSWNTDSVTSLNSTFAFCTSLEEVDLTNWNVSKVTSFNAMFQSTTDHGNMALTSIGDVSNWDTSKVTTMRAMFQSCASLTELDISNWNTSSCTDMSFMFWGARSIGALDVSNWDVSKVTNFDHMMAHSYAILNGVENWEVSSACTNMNAMFLGVKNTSWDVSKFDTSNVQFFSQMFQENYWLTEIIGLENWDTSNGRGFEEMFQYCSNLRELDLSSFDTRKAKDGVVGSTNGHLTATMQNMFQDNFRLKKIALGENFSFKGDGTTTNTANYAVLPTPSADYIYGADGNWYTEDGEAYAPAEVPDKTAAVYYAVLPVAISTGKKFLLHRMFSKPIAYALTGRWGVCPVARN